MINFRHRIHSRDGREDAQTGTEAGRAGLPVGLAVIQMVLAYEWLISGINKLINPNFTAQLASTLRDGMKGNPYGWYNSLVSAVILPHASVVGVLTEIGEFAIGITLLGSALLWLWRPSGALTRLAAGGAIIALAGGAFLSLNYFLQGGTTLPWINAANAFNEGVDIDVMIPLISVALLVSNARALGRSARRGFSRARFGSARLSRAS